MKTTHPAIRLSFLFFLFLGISNTASAQLDVANAQYEEAVALYAKAAFEKALVPAQVADSIFHALGETALELKSKVLIGKVYASRRQFQNALLVAEKALKLVVPAGKQDSLIEAEALNTYANSLQELWRLEESETAYWRAIAIKKKLFGDNTTEIGLQISNLANLYFKKGDMAKAVKFGKNGIAIREGGVSPNPKLLTAYTNLGIIHKQVGLYQQALGYFDKVEQVINTDPVKYLERIGPLNRSLANLYHDLGDFDKAKQYEELSILNFRQQFGPESIMVGDGYYNLALIAYDLKERAVEIGYAKQALAVYLNAPDKDPARIANCYEQLCIGFLDNAPDSALYYAQLSGVLLDEAGVEDGLERGGNLTYMAQAYAKMGDLHKADSLTAIGVAQVRAVYGNRNILTGNFLTIHAYIMTLAGRMEEALALYKESLNAFGYSKGCQWDTVVHADQLLEVLGNMNQTRINLYQKTPTRALDNDIADGWTEVLQLLDYLRYRHQGTDAKLLFASQFTTVAEIALKWYDQNPTPKNTEKAWEFVEKARSLALLEAFRSANAWNVAIAADSLRSLADAFSAEKKKWYDLYVASEDETERADYLSKLLKTGHQQEDWLHVLERQDSVFFKAKYDSRIATIKTVRALLQPQQALLEYFVGDKSIFLFVVRADTTIVEEIKNDFPLEDWIGQFRQGLYGYYTVSEDSISDELYEKTLNLYLEFGAKLYQKLCAPVQDWLPEKVIIVPDGPLGYIPFDALLTGTPKDLNDFKSYPFWWKSRQISYTYSATLLQEMRQKKHRIAPSKSFVAFAPFYQNGGALPNNKNKFKGLMGKELEPLPYSGTEVSTAAKLMKGAFYVDDAATKALFTNIAGSYRIVHLASHNLADSRAGNYSFMAFAKLKDSLVNELLFLQDLYNLELNADLVVLSACETGIGKLQRGEGILSLARAFAFAGAKSLVTSLWEVNNQSTSELMGYFYEGLSVGNTKDEALRMARKRYFNEQLVGQCHPFFWAAFVPVGDMRAVK